MSDWTASVTVVFLAAHLLAVNVPSVSPLIAIWLHARGRRGDTAAYAIGRQFALASFWSLLAGIVSGAVLVAFLWAADDRAYWNAVQRLPARAYGFALCELAFTVACLAVYVAMWDRWRHRPWLHAIFAILATTNLVYHFPPLMIVLGNLASRPELVEDELVTRPVFRGLLLRRDLLAQLLHFMVASVAVAGVALMLVAARNRERFERAYAVDSLIAAGARIALVASLVQLATGVWLLVQLPDMQRSALLGEDWLLTVFFFLSVLAAFGVLYSLASVAFGDARCAAVYRAAVLMLTVVVLMTGTMTRARRIEEPSGDHVRLISNEQRSQSMKPHVADIRDPDSGSTARVLVSLGFNCFSWRPALEDGPREMLWADAEFDGGEKRPSGSGIPLLFPFPGRIAGAKLRFEDRDFELEPGDAFGNAIHGFVYNRPWRVIEQSDARVVGEFHASVDDAAILERWPSDFRIQVSYEVRGRELISNIRYENAGGEPLPCGFATHAYFRLPLAEDRNAAETVVTLPVDEQWELENMIPTGKKSQVPADRNLADGLPLGNHKFDTCFTGLRADSDELVRTRLSTPSSGRDLTQTFDRSFTQCVVYTPPHREAICMEPYTCVPDAVRLAEEGHETGLQILQPGESRETTIRIDVNR